MKKIWTSCCVVLLLIWAHHTLHARENVQRIKGAGSTFLTFSDVYDPLALAHIKLALARGEKLVWSKPDSALMYLNQALEESTRIDYPDGIARAYTNMGIMEAGLGAFDSSQTCYWLAYPHVLRSPDRAYLLCGLYINMGVTHFYEAEYEKASYYYYLVLQHMLKYNTSNFNIVMAYNNLADVLMRLEQYDQAAYYIGKGEALLNPSDDWYIRALLTANKAGVATGKGDDSTARVLLNKALLFAQRSNSTEIMPAIWNALGEITLRQQHPEEAIVYLRQALDTDTLYFPYYSAIAPGYNLGNALSQIGKYKEAEQVLLKALHRAERSGIKEGKHDAVATLAKVYEALGQPLKALEQQKRFSLLLDSILDKEKIRAINAMEVRYRTTEKDRELVSKQLEISVQKRNIDRKNLWLGLSAAGVLLVLLSSLIVYHNNKQKQAIAVLEAMIAGEEKERSRTAQELHDGIGGLLASIQMKLSMVHADGVADIAAMTKDAAIEIRRTAHNLMPDVLQRCSFAEAVGLYCDTLNQAGKLQVDFQLHEPVLISNKNIELSLYRIIQELLQNVVKHAQATYAVVQVSQQQNKLTIIVEDNGKGFDTRYVSKGLGLHNLHLRAKMLKGDLTIESIPGRGTIATIAIPANA